MDIGQNTHRAILAGSLVFSLLVAGQVGAAPSTAPLSADDQALIARSTEYLQGLGEVKGRFEQIDARGGVSHGDLYLNRPGKARFAFDPPSGILVVSDGSNVLVANPRLKTAPRYPLGSTPLSLLLAKQIRLDKGVVVSAVAHFSDGYSLTAHDARHPGQGQITLVFSQNPVQLKEWRMTDSQGRTTEIRLTELQPAPGLDPNLFVLPQVKTGH